MKKLLLLACVSLALINAYADDNSSGDVGLVNNADLNRRMASNKQFSQDRVPQAKTNSTGANSSGDDGLVNNADLNRRMASNKQFSNKKSDNKVALDDQAKNSATVNLKSASNKLF
jgi:hypothetical protein